MSGLSRTQKPNSAISVGGSLEPIDPVYTRANHQNPLGTASHIPSEPTTWKAPVVHRAADTRGMRYLYANQHVRMPISPLGQGPDIGNAVWSSEFQPTQGSLRDYGFYDLLFKAGYPGFNLGISFKVAVNPSVGSRAPGYNIGARGPAPKLVINVLKRATGTANRRG